MTRLLRCSMFVVGTFALSLTAFAQSEPAPDGGDVRNAPSTTVYDFEDDFVEGDLQRPDDEPLVLPTVTGQPSLIEIRKDFVPEILKSVEDV